MKSDREVTTSYIRLNERVLRRGDIILVTQSSKMSTAIRIATRSDVSHAMVYVQDRSVIDARPGGVRSSNTQRLFLESKWPVYALRLRSDPTPEQLDVIERELRGKIGTRYSESQAMLTLVPANLEADRRQFCSRLVAQAYAAAGIELVTDANFCSPGDLQRSDLLTPVSDATVPVTEEEIAFFDSRDDIPELMHEATNALLDGARTFDPTIEDLDEVIRFIAEHPEHDDAICDILDRSGYLEIWQIEKDKNPWQYDLALMGAEPQGSMAEYCWDVIRNEGDQSHRFVLNRGGYDFLVRQFGRRYFRKMAELYETLASLHEDRVTAAQGWLVANGHIAPSDPPPLVPHSPEWFSAFQQWSPAQALMTRQIIELAGRSDVCSVCGDDPAADYRLVPEQRPAAGVDTLRLCIDCVDIRRNAGEAYVPL